MTAIERMIPILFLCLWSLGQVQAQGGPPGLAGTPYVLFIHSGPKSPNDPVVKRLAVALARQGYSVREPEPDQDKVGGPGVDYFDDAAKAKAQEVANAINDYFSQNAPPGDAPKKLQPRRQSTKNAANYLGVWLY
ncbi:hypothetical protein [uncultured Bradyrhizobium sp.]|uniref:hypothetical protein n=1 Tax=uncultured Bradyrhizobium sp. TaxID=199684 RepID=UPI0035CC5762